MAFLAFALRLAGRDFIERPFFLAAFLAFFRAGALAFAFLALAFLGAAFLAAAFRAAGRAAGRAALGDAGV